MTCDKCNRELIIKRNWDNVIVQMRCPKHGLDYTGFTPDKIRIKKWSGKSQTPYGSYEDR